MSARCLLGFHVPGRSRYATPACRFVTRCTRCRKIVFDDLGWIAPKREQARRLRRASREPTEDTLAETLRERDLARRERDEVYAVNAAANYDRANAAEEALREIEALCEPERIPLPKLNSLILRVIRASRGGSTDGQEVAPSGPSCQTARRDG